MRKLTSAIKVQPVIARADEKLFLSVPQRVYAGDRHWVPPLHSHVAKKFAQSCPFLRHGKLQRFIVLAPGKRIRAEAVGRIVAGVDYNLAGEDATVGLIGFFDCIEDVEVAQALLNAACQWLRGQGMKTARNSIGRSDSGERLFYEGLIQIDGFGLPPMLMMPYNPPYYPQFFEQNGWSKFKDAYAYHFNVEKGLPQSYTATLSKAYQNAVEAGIAFRHINIHGKNFRRDCEAIYHLAFEQLNFEGPHREEFLEDIKILRSIIGVPAGCILAEDKATDTLVGVALCMPDYNILLRQLGGSYNPVGLLRALRYLRRVDQGRGVLIGSLPKYRRLGVPMALYYRVMQLASAREGRGYKQFEISWIFEDNPGSQMLCEVSGAEIRKTYRIYEKTL